MFRLHSSILFVWYTASARCLLGTYKKHKHKQVKQVKQVKQDTQTDQEYKSMIVYIYLSFCSSANFTKKKHLPCSHQSESSHLESSEMRSFWRKDLALKRPTHMKHRRSEETHVIGSWCLGLDVQGGPLPVISEQIPLPLFLKNPSFTHYKAIWVKNPPNIHWVSYPCH